MIVAASVDSWVDQAVPDANHGDAAKLAVHQGANNRRAYVFFPKPFPDGSQILSATLRLYRANDWSGSRNVIVKRVQSAWKEGRITWADQPNFTADDMQTVAVAGGADGEVIEFDVKAMLQAASNGQNYHGFQITIDDTDQLRIYSSDYPDVTLHPSLECEWAEGPEPPNRLTPSGEGAIGTREPELHWEFNDVGDEGTQLYSQVQIDTSDTFGSPDYDTKKTANVNDSWQTTTVSAETGAVDWGAGMTSGVTYYWRVKVWDDAGLESEWSDVAEMVYLAQGTLTLTNPPVAGFVEERTPPIAWNLSGASQEMARVILFRVRDSGELVEEWRFPKTVTNANSQTVPQGILKTGRNYRVRVSTWDNADRQSVPGSLANLKVERDFIYDKSGAPADTTSITATPGPTGHWVDLTWVRTTMPDEFCIVVDGEEEQHVEAPDVHTGVGNNYAMQYWRSTPGTTHTFEVEAVTEVSGKDLHGDSANSDTALCKPKGICFADDSNPINVRYVVMRGTDGPDLQIAETAETFRLVGARKPVRVTDSMGGYEGQVSGMLMSNHEKDIFERMKGDLNELRLIIADLNVPVVLGDTSIQPTPESVTRWIINADVAQVGEFTFDYP